MDIDDIQTKIAQRLQAAFQYAQGGVDFETTALVVTMRDQKCAEKVVQKHFGKLDVPTGDVADVLKGDLSLHLPQLAVGRGFVDPRSLFSETMPGSEHAWRRVAITIHLLSNNTLPDSVKKARHRLTQLQGGSTGTPVDTYQRQLRCEAADCATASHFPKASSIVSTLPPSVYARTTGFVSPGQPRDAGGSRWSRVARQTLVDAVLADERDAHELESALSEVLSDYANPADAVARVRNAGREARVDRLHETSKVDSPPSRFVCGIPLPSATPVTLRGLGETNLCIDEELAPQGALRLVVLFDEKGKLLPLKGNENDERAIFAAATRDFHSIVATCVGVEDQSMQLCVLPLL